MRRFWSEAYYYPDTPMAVKAGDQRKIVTKAPGGHIVFTLLAGEEPTEEEVEVATQKVMTDLQNAEE